MLISAKESGVTIKIRRQLVNDTLPTMKGKPGHPGGMKPIVQCSDIVKGPWNVNQYHGYSTNSFRTPPAGKRGVIDG